MTAAPADPEPPTVDMRLAALWWARRGVPVFPLHHPVLTPKLTWACSCPAGEACGKSAGKHPLTSNGLNAASTDVVQVSRWWEAHPEANIGLRTGVEFDVIDVDGPAGEQSYAELSDQLGPVEHMCEVRTGRPDGGRHLYVTPPLARNGTGGLAGLPPGIDLRGQGGYVVAPPSVHLSGARYSTVTEYGTLVAGTSWQDWHAALTAVPEPVTPAVASPAPAPAGPPRDATRSQAWATAVLGRRCAELAATPEGQRETYMSRFAVVDAARLVAAGSLNRDTAVDAITEAGRRAGLTEREVGKVGRELDKLVPKVTKPLTPADRAAMEQPRVLPPEPAPATTPDDDLFDGPGQPLTRTPPPFPTWALGPVEQAIDTLAEELQVPPDIPAMMFLATLAATIRGRAVIRVTDRWTEPLNLYVCVVAGAGEAKSPALAAVSGPLRDLERRMVEQARPATTEAASRRRVAEARIHAAEAKLAKATDQGERGQLEADLRAEQETAALLPAATPPRLLVGDVTPEALAKLMAEQGGVLASLSAEGGLLDTLAGRYSRGVANLDVVLNGHDGREPVVVDRKGDAEPIRIERPCLTLGLAVQPQVLAALGASDAAVGRGLTARFLYSVPNSLVGTRDMRLDRGAKSATTSFGTVIDGVLAILAPHSLGDSRSTTTTTVVLEGPCRSLFEAWRTDLEVRRHSVTGDLAGLGAWALKLDGQVARLMGLLAIMRTAMDGTTDASLSTVVPKWPITVSVTEDDLVMSLAVADYLIEHAKIAYDLLRGGRGQVARARQLLSWAVALPEPTFTVRDAYRSLKGRTSFSLAEDVHDAAVELERLGWLARIVPTEPKRGRPSIAYRVNPAALTEGAT